MGSHYISIVALLSYPHMGCHALMCVVIIKIMLLSDVTMLVLNVIPTSYAFKIVLCKYFNIKVPDKYVITEEPMKL